MGEVIAIAVIICIIGGAGIYIWKAKKSGAKCIGCPHAKQCKAKCSKCQSTFGNKTLQK